MTSSTVVGVIGSPLDGWSSEARSFRKPIASLRYGVWFKANPRPGGYMAAKFHEMYPDGHLVAPSSPLIESAQTVVFLYADSIGLRWSKIEREVRRAAPRCADFSYLNGRGRAQELSTRRLFSLRFRRFLELSMILEVAICLLLLVLVPVLTVIDLIRGRR